MGFVHSKFEKKRLKNSLKKSNFQLLSVLTVDSQVSNVFIHWGVSYKGVFVMNFFSALMLFPYEKEVLKDY